MNTQVAEKGITASVLFIASYISNEVLNVLFFILLIVMVADFATGVIAARIDRTLESKKGLIGMLKKVGYLLLVVTAFMVDLAIMHILTPLGINPPINSFFGIIVTGWLIANEGISILENLAKMDANVPPFLLRGLKIFKKKIEDAADKSIDKNIASNADKREEKNDVQ